MELNEEETPESFLEKISAKYYLNTGNGAENIDPISRLDNFASELRNASALILIDGTEKAPELALWLMKHLLPKLRGLWSDGRGSGRVIFSGRNPLSWPMPSQLHYYSLTLTPFEPEAIAEMVGKYFIRRRRIWTHLA